MEQRRATLFGFDSKTSACTVCPSDINILFRVEIKYNPIADSIEFRDEDGELYRHRGGTVSVTPTANTPRTMTTSARTRSALHHWLEVPDGHFHGQRLGHYLWRLCGHRRRDRH